VLPSGLPYIFAGLRVAMAQCLVGVVVAEMTGSLAGLGRLIVVAASRFGTAEMLVPILVIMVSAIMLTEVMRRLHIVLASQRHTQVGP
jgi:ABC-type nitrate/sulfonate/bicarbonate transport system permease component